MKVRILISCVILLFILFLVGKEVNIPRLQRLLFAFPPMNLILLFSLSYLMSVLKSYRFLLLLRENNVNLTFWENLRAFVASQAISPLPGGEAMRGFLVHKETGIHIHKTTGPVVTQAFLELFSAGILMLLGSFVFRLFRLPAGIFIVCMILLFYFLVNEKATVVVSRNLHLSKKLTSFTKILRKTQKALKALVFDQESGLVDKVVVRAFVLSILSHCIGGVLLWTIAKSYHTDVSTINAVFIYTIGIVVQGVGSISPGGIGFTEGGMTGVLLLSGVDVNKSVAIVLIYRFTTLVFSIFIGLIYLLLFYGKVLLRK